MEKIIDFRRGVVQLLALGSFALTITAVMALTGCGGGGSGSSSSGAVSGNGRGSVIVRVPFAGSGANSSKLQAAFPSSVNHVEIELFGGGIAPTVAIGTHHDNSVTFPDVPPGEKWILFLAVNDSSTVLLPGTFTGTGQRVLTQGALTPSRIFSMAAVRVDVVPGTNVVDTLTIGGAANSSFVFGQRTVGGLTGLELTASDITGTDRLLVVDDSTGAQEAGTLNNASSAFVSMNSPVSNAMILPLPLGSSFMGDFTRNQVSGNITTPFENCHREIVVVGTDPVALPGASTSLLHLRTTDICTPLAGGSVKKIVRDQWFRTSALAGGAPVGLALATERLESSSNTAGNLFSSDAIRILNSSTASTNPLSSALGTDLLIGSGTAWNFVGVQTTPGGSLVGSAGSSGGNGGGTNGGGQTLTSGFFPLNNGDVREYRETQSNNTTINFRDETGSPTTPAGFSEPVIPINEFFFPDNIKTLFDTEFFTADNTNGVRHHGFQSFGFVSTPACLIRDIPPRQVPNGLTVGQSTAVQNITETVISGTCTGGAGTFRATLEAIENVTVPAGTFVNCPRLRLDETDSFGTDTNTLWLAQGIGIVKSLEVNGGSHVAELTFARVGNVTVGSEGSFGGGLSRVIRPQSRQSRPQLRRSRLRGW